MNTINNTIGVILSAGRGERLRPFTDTSPKPLAVIQNMTLLERNMEKMFDLVESYVIVVNWLAEKIMAEIGHEYKGKPVRYALQDNPKGGTLDAFRTAVEIIKDSKKSYIVANGDDLRGGKFYHDLKKLIETQPDMPAISAKKENDHSRLSSFGVILKGENGNFVKIVEKPAEYVSDLVNIGLYYFPTHILGLIPKKPEIYQKEEYIIDLFNEYNEPIKVIESPDYFYTVTNMDDMLRLQVDSKLIL